MRVRHPIFTCLKVISTKKLASWLILDRTIFPTQPAQK